MEYREEECLALENKHTWYKRWYTRHREAVTWYIRQTSHTEAVTWYRSQRPGIWRRRHDIGDRELAEGDGDTL